MKLHSVFFGLCVAATLNAGETSIEKYTELRNESTELKIKEYRNLLLQQRNANQELRDDRGNLRDKRLKELYARIQSNYTPYR